MFSSAAALASIVRSRLRLSSTSLLHSPWKPKDAIFLLQDPFKRFFSSKQQQKQSFTISYLTNRCGLSEEEALSVAKVVSFSSPAKPDNVMRLLSLRGFTQLEVARIICKFPGTLCMCTEKNLSPKLDFLTSRGFSAAEVRKILLASPHILMRSLDAHIVPSFDFIAKALLSDDKKTRLAILRYPSLLTINLRKVFVPKMKLLMDVGVSEKNIAFLLCCQPRQFKTPPDRFERIVHRAVDMGISPSKVIFVIAIQTLWQLSESTWDLKLEVYSRWGWSEEMTLRAFAKYPWIMCVSVSKITAVMDFYKNEMGIESSYIADHPGMLWFSLEKRTKPRCSVFRYLRAKGLVKDISLNSALAVPEPKFLDMYVARFPDESKVLLSIYLEKMGSISSKEKASSSIDHL